ncbi:MAG TPA: hypothetical protein ENG13_04945 [bacterium]|nr:hypothetical protein [bacterium]HEX68393.1 hypothetical protein [bacterium]
MTRVKLTDRKTRMGLRVAKVLILGRWRAPTSFNLCVSSKLKGKKHPPAPEGAGGMRNKGWHEEFVKAVRACATGK